MLSQLLTSSGRYKLAAEALSAGSELLRTAFVEKAALELRANGAQLELERTGGLSTETVRSLDYFGTYDLDTPADRTTAEEIVAAVRSHANETRSKHIAGEVKKFSYEDGARIVDYGLTVSIDPNETEPTFHHSSAFNEESNDGQSTNHANYDAFISTDALKTVEAIAGKYVHDLVANHTFLNTREKAALLELSAGDHALPSHQRVLREETIGDLIKTAQREFPKDRDLIVAATATQNPNALLKLAKALHMRADFEAEEMRKQQAAAKEAAAFAWRQRTGGTLEGEARELLKQVDWWSDYSDSHEVRMDGADFEVQAMKALTKFAEVNPIGALKLYNEQVPEDFFPQWAEKPLPNFTFPNATWEQITKAVSDLVQQGKTSDPRLTLDDLTQPEPSRTPTGQTFSLFRAVAAQAREEKWRNPNGPAQDFLDAYKDAREILFEKNREKDLEVIRG